MDDGRIAAVFYDKLEHKQIIDAFIESGEQINIEIAADIVAKDGLGTVTSDDWKILKNICRTRSGLIPLLSAAYQGENVRVGGEHFGELIERMEEVEAFLNYISNNYERLSSKSSLDKILPKDRIKPELEGLAAEEGRFAEQIANTGHIDIASDKITALRRILDLSMYAILGKELYKKFAEESQRAMLTLSDYQNRIVSSDVTKN